MDYNNYLVGDKLDLSNKNLTKFLFNDLPNNIREKIKILYLGNNQLTSFSFENCPQTLRFLWLDGNGNQLTNASVIGNPPNNCIVIGLITHKDINYTKFVRCSGQCIICFDNDDNLIQLPCFSTHNYHIDCLKEWFNSCDILLKNKCCLCQKIII